MSNEESTTNSAEVVENTEVSKGKRGRQPTEYLTEAKFVKAVRAGEVLPGMERVEEVMEGSKITTHRGWKATVFEPTSTGLNILRLATIGKNQKPEVIETLPFTFEEVISKLTYVAPAKKAKNVPATE